MEAFGCTVNWDSVNKTAIAEKNGITVQVPIGASYIMKDGQKIANDTIALIKDNRTYLPIRAVLEAFGAYVGWNGKTQTVFAVSDGKNTITNLINQSGYFKGAPKELCLGEAIRGSFSDQGVTVQYRAAFSDGEAIYLFFDLIDTGANLFCEGGNGKDFSLDKYDFFEKTGYTDSRMYDVISYDEKTRTATICVEYIGPLQNDSISFHINSMSGNQKVINYTLDDVDLYDMLKKTTGEFESEDQFVGCHTSFSILDEKTGAINNVGMPDFEEGNGNSVYRLKKDAFALALENENGNHVADITNIGWRDGWLHVQINPENDIKWDHTNFNLKNNKTIELVYSPFHISFGARDDGRGQDNYYEYMFYVGDFTKENLNYSIAFRNSVYKATDLTGDWEIGFAIPDAMVKKLEVNKPIPVKGHELLMQRAVISPVKITLFASSKDVPDERDNWFYGLSVDDLDLKIVYQDGKTVDIPKKSGYIHGNQKGDMFRITYTAENFDDIAGLEVNGVLLPVVD
jgi:Copper amine oxidase N-terminal domain.